MSQRKHIMGAAILGLIGVVLGFFLSVVYDEWKSRRKRKEIKEGLLEELRANLQMLPQKRDIVEQIIINLNEGLLLPGSSAHFLRLFYGNHFSFIFPELSVRERNSFHILYEYFITIDRVLDDYADRIVESMDTDKIDNYVRLYQVMMKDVLAVLNLSEKLIAKHLQGKPEDVLYAGEDYVKLIQAKYGEDK